ncbi:MAG TPA: amidohydrolase, partial [Firmicutes bacterium]|nr:amidohydrolase [Bacillota bacterium]
MLAIINARIDTVSNGIIADGQILVENGKIKAIGTNLEIPANARCIDAAGRTVTPGIVEAHAHIGIGEQGVGWEGQDTNETSAPITPWCSALDGINMRDTAFDDFRRAGITSVSVPPGSANIIGGTAVALKCKGAIVDDAVIRVTGMKCALGENPKAVYGGKNKAPSTRMGNAALMREALLKAKQYLAKLEAAKSEKDKPKFDKQSEALLPVMRGELPLMIHCHRSDDIVTAVRICEEFGVRYVLEHVTDGFLLVDFLKERNIHCAVGPTMHYGSKVENRERDFRTPVALARAGINFCFTTDHAVLAGQWLPLTAGLAVGWGMDRDTAF